MLSPEEWLEQISSLFANPDSLIFGKEIVDQALERFSTVIEFILSTYPHKISLWSLMA